MILAHHAALLDASAISPTVREARGYRSVTAAAELAGLGFSKAQRSVPGLLIPIHAVDGTIRLHQYRPDAPRLNASGKTLKYETPYGARLALDVPPGIRGDLGNPAIPLWITEGSRKADAAVSAGLCCIGLLGVYGWRGTNDAGGKTALPDWESVALKGRRVYVAFDSDVMLKPEVETAFKRVSAFLTFRHASVTPIYLPATDGRKVGLDDYLAAGHTVAELLALTTRPCSTASQPTPTPRAPAAPRTLADVEQAFGRWLHDHDHEPTRAMLAAYVANRMFEGDPVWLMLVGGSGVGKTERLLPLAAMADVVMASSITGPAALLSGTGQKERAKDATGGLLRRVPAGGGVLLLKDFTSILEMHRDSRAEVLAALREVYDGRWDRNVGAEGGRTLTWIGRLGLVAGCTTAIDSAHAVLASMGPRFLLVRVDGTHQDDLGLSALSQESTERAMRSELQDAVRGLLEHLPGEERPIDDDARDRLVALACYIAVARSPVDRDHQGEIRLVLDAEAPTRIVKMLGLLWRASGFLGLDCAGAWAMVRRVGLDSIPKLRRAVLDALAIPLLPQTTSEVAETVEHPSSTTRRALEDLTAHHVVVRTSEGPGRADRWQLSAQTLKRLERLDRTFPALSEVGVPDPLITQPWGQSERGTKSVQYSNDDIAGKVAGGGREVPDGRLI